MFVTLLLPSNLLLPRRMRKNKYVIWCVFEFDRATLPTRSRSRICFSPQRDTSSYILEKQHDATCSLTRFSTRHVHDIGDFSETLGVVSNCTTYTYLQQVTERKYDSCPCRQMNPAATPTFSHVYLPLQSQQSTGRKLPSLRLKTFIYRVFRQTPRVGHVDF